MGWINFLRCLRRCAAALVIAVPIIAPAAAAGALDACTDVALVLAVDGSGSVDAREYRLQKQAIAHALRDRDVLSAFSAAGTVSAAVIFWGDAGLPVHHVEAVTIRSARDAERLARAVEDQPRRTRGTTGLGAGLAAALDRLETMGCAHRAIVNVSGDGKETIFPRKRKARASPEEARDRARLEGVTINALVITGASPGLAAYYADSAIAGPGAFVMEIGGYGDYAVALKRKLIREISPARISKAD